VCGTSLVVSAFLHLPALIHLGKLQDLIEQIKSNGVLCSGLQGDPEDFVGDVLVIRNAYTIGINEESILGLIRSTILKLLVAEKSARNSLVKEHTTKAIDTIGRALGTLKFSYQLETAEALNALSHVKLGIELGWVQGMSVQEVNKLFFGCRRAHLNYSLHEKILVEQVAAKRADYLRSQAERLKFDIHEKKDT
jgi:protein arginine kinase